MYFQRGTHVYVGASMLSLAWTEFWVVCETLSLFGSLTIACVLCCRLICWQRDCAYELYSVLISTLHSDHYIRFLWWRLIALSLWGGGGGGGCGVGGGGVKLYRWGSTTHVHRMHKFHSQDHTRKCQWWETHKSCTCITKICKSALKNTVLGYNYIKYSPQKYI